MTGWTKIRAAPVGGVYRHPSGWVATHCGHQTALWPYTLSHPGHKHGVTSFNGRGFVTLTAALLVVEGLVAGRFTITAERCVPGLLRVREATALGKLAAVVEGIEAMLAQEGVNVGRVLVPLRF